MCTKLTKPSNYLAANISVPVLILILELVISICTFLWKGLKLRILAPFLWTDSKDSPSVVDFQASGFIILYIYNDLAI